MLGLEFLSDLCYKDRSAVRQRAHTRNAKRIFGVRVKLKPNPKIQRTAKSVMPFATAKALPLLASADFGVLHFEIIIAIALLKAGICRIDTKYTKEAISSRAVTEVLRHNCVTEDYLC